MKTLVESGIKWLGHIPASWELGKIGGLYALRTEKVSDKDYPPLSVTMKGILPQLETAAKTNDGDNRKLVRKGDFAINSRSDRRGSCGISEYDGSVSLINLVLTPRRTMCPQYYNWLFHTIQFADEFYSWGHGIVSDLWSTNWQEMKKITIPIPSLDEQRIIADFLDAQCAKIDDLLESLRQQILQLQSYRESTITEAVTRGLNPDVTLIDSGKEWCPQIPAHWIPTNPKALFTLRNQRAKEGERQLTASQKLGIVYQDEFMESEGQKVVTVEKDFSILKHVEPNDFVISMRSFQGGLEYSELSGSISSAYVMLIPNDAKVYPPFYKWFFKSSKYINAIQSTTNLVRDGQAMRYANFVKVPLFIIPMEEQIEIADYLNERITKVDSIIADKQNQLSTLIVNSVVYDRSLSIAIGVLKSNALTTFSLPSSVRWVASGFWNNFTSLKQIKISSQLESYGNKSYSRWWNGFSGMKNLHTITLEGVDVFPKGIVDYCDSIEEIIIAEGIREIPQFAFNSCKSLIRLFIPRSCVIIGDHALPRVIERSHYGLVAESHYPKEFAIYCYRDSYAEQYAKEEDAPIVYI